jgi:hypothetical protein
MKALVLKRYGGAKNVEFADLPGQPSSRMRSWSRFTRQASIPLIT